MIVYTFDNTLDGLLSAVFDAFNNHEMPNDLLTAGNALPLFCDHIHEVHTDENKSQRKRHHRQDNAQGNFSEMKEFRCFAHSNDREHIIQQRQIFDIVDSDLYIRTEKGLYAEQQCLQIMMQQVQRKD